MKLQKDEAIQKEEDFKKSMSDYVNLVKVDNHFKEEEEKTKKQNYFLLQRNNAMENLEKAKKKKRDGLISIDQERKMYSPI